MTALGRAGALLWIGAAVASLAAPADAQTAATGTGAPTREEIDRPGLRPDDRPSRLTIDGEVERAPCPLAGPEYAAITFTLREVQFANLTVLSPDALRSAYADYVGQTVPLATVCEIRDRAATILRRAGYLAAVQVPPQEIENGIVRFDVLVAKLTAVQVRGDAGRSERLVARFLEQLTEQPAFNEREAERALLLLRDLPGYDIRLTLRPAGTAPGEVIGEVSVVHTPVEVDFSAQNYGSRSVGRFGGLLRAQVNGLTGLGDRTSLGVYSTADFEEQLVLQASHDFALATDGLRLAGRFTHAWTEPGGTAGLDIESRTLLAGLEATYPFIRRQTGSLFGAFGLDFVNQEIDLVGVTTNRDKLRVVYGRLDADTSDGGGLFADPGRLRAGLSLEVRKGLDILDATRFVAGSPVQQTRVPGTSKGFVLRGSGVLEFRAAPRVTFWVSPRAQYSDDPLLSFEEFSAGNYTAGRGYDPGALVGDSGVGVQAELRFGSTQPASVNDVALQGYVFGDHARTWNNRDGLRGSDSLASAGGGIRVAFGDRARLDVAVAVPLKRLPFATDKPDPRILISLTTRLVPWRR